MSKILFSSKFIFKILVRMKITSEILKMKHYIARIVFLFLAINSYGQQENCNWKTIERLGVFFQDTIAKGGILCDDPDDPRFGQLTDTTRSHAAVILRDKYFKTCLKGKNHDYFNSLLGNGYLREGQENTSCVPCESELIYSLQIYNFEGEPLDHLPSTVSIAFDKEGLAISMSVISY